MTGQGNVLLMTPNPPLISAVDQALHGSGYLLDRSKYPAIHDLLAQLSRRAPALVLVDLDPRPQDVLPHLEKLIARFTATRFIALAETVDSELLMEAMSAGLRRVVTKRTLEAELREALKRLTAQVTESAGAKGDVVTILSASGGCGATTIAINLAEEWASKNQGKPTLLIDMDSAYGAMATYLGLEPQYGIDQLLGYSGPIDSELLRTTTTACGESMHMLASPVSIRFARPEPLNLSRMDEALRCARHAYRQTIIDAPRVSMEAASILAAASDLTLLVFQLTVKDVRTARSMIEALGEWGVARSSILPVANRHAKRQMITLDDAQKALGGMDLASIRNDYTATITGLNYGQTLSQAAPRSVLRKDLQDLLAQVQESYLVLTIA
jgi:pilus assembly protein CpaE